MPSLHAADALIVGLVLASVCRNRVAKVLWLLWPAWVWFSVMATGNHFWLDVVGGIVVAVIAGLIVVPQPAAPPPHRRRLRPRDAAPRPSPGSSAATPTAPAGSPRAGSAASRARA